MEDDEKQSGEGPTGEGKAGREDFVQVFKRGAQFTEELLKENERLRYRLAEVETRNGGDDDALVKELVEKVQRLEVERDKMIKRFAEVEAENRDFAQRYVEVEAENNKLLNLYIASYQLHSTLDFDDVLRTITEIVLNFVGAEVFTIALVSEENQGLRPLVAEGVDPEAVSELPTDDGLVGQSIATGEAFFAEDIGVEAPTDPRHPLAAIPLRLKNSVLGVIIVYRFLRQKTEWTSVDHELFTLLAGHAATAIFASKLYTDTTRKLKTIQGLIDLVTS